MKRCVEMTNLTTLTLTAVTSLSRAGQPYYPNTVTSYPSPLNVGGDTRGAVAGKAIYARRSCPEGPTGCRGNGAPRKTATELNCVIRDSYPTTITTFSQAASPHARVPPRRGQAPWDSPHVGKLPLAPARRVASRARPGPGGMSGIGVMVCRVARM